MKPVRYEGKTAVFTTRDIDDYGMPELYGYDEYIVVESRELNVATDYKFEQDREWKTIHRYSRLARFKKTFLNLLGERGSIPQPVLTIVSTYMPPDSVDKWNDVRKILKHYKQRNYYDNIPMILFKLGYGRCFPQLTGEQINGITNDFKHISTKYEQIKNSHNRRYFPNIRYIVLKLLELHGYTPKYAIPFIRTHRKRKALTSIWSTVAQ